MSGILIQFWATTIMSLGNFLTGYCIAWPSFALHTLQSEKSPTGSPITDLEANLVGSLIMLGNVAIIPVSAWVSDVIGKKKACILSALGFTLSWAIIATARSVVLLLIGRFIQGLASGLQAVICLPFVAEISKDSVRGALGSMTALTYTFGILVAYLAGWFCSYAVVNYINLSLSVLFVLLSCTLKETPAFLVAILKNKEALNSLKFYRGKSEATSEILEEMTCLCHQSDTKIRSSDAEIPLNVESEKEQLKETEEKNRIELSPWKTLCTSKPAQRALFVVTVNVVLLVLGGTIAVSTYATQLFKMAAPNLSNELCSVILALSFFVGSIFSSVVCDLVGRRVLMLSSTIASAVFLAVLASILRWSWAPEWTVPAAVLGYCFVFQMGAASVPFIQTSECFIHKLKNLASTISNCACCLANFAVLALFPPSVELLGLDGVFLVFSFVCILLSLTSYFLMRETRGRAVDDIQKMFENGILYKKE